MPVQAADNKSRKRRQDRSDGEEATNKTRVVDGCKRPTINRETDGRIEVLAKKRPTRPGSWTAVPVQAVDSDSDSSFEK